MVSLYLPDEHSPRAAEQVLKAPPGILVSSLVELEAVNAMQLRVFRKERTVLQTTKSVEAFESDIAAGVFRALAVPPSAWTVASRVSRTHSAKLGARSLDILQIAIAIVLRADALLTFDRNQTALAHAEGLKTQI